MNNIFLEEAQEKRLEADQKYQEIVKTIQEYHSGTINIDIMGNLLIDLPFMVYSKSLELIDITEEILLIQKKMKIIEDNESQEISKDPDLKNQAQRDSTLRMRLLVNETYNQLEKAVAKYIKSKNTLQAQIEYYNALLSGVKIRYRQATAVIIGDQKLQEAINNG